MNDIMFFKNGLCLNLELKRNINFDDEKLLNYICTYFCRYIKDNLTLSKEDKHKLDLTIQRINR